MKPNLRLLILLGLLAGTGGVIYITTHAEGRNSDRHLERSTNLPAPMPEHRGVSPSKAGDQVEQPRDSDGKPVPWSDDQTFLASLPLRPFDLGMR